MVDLLLGALELSVERRDLLVLHVDHAHQLLQLAAHHVQLVADVIHRLLSIKTTTVSSLPTSSIVCCQSK